MIPITGTDIELVKVHDRYADQISDILSNLQDDTAKRMAQLLDEANDKIEELNSQVTQYKSIADAALITCRTCGGSGFSRPGSGYDAVCDDCTGGYVGYATGEMVNALNDLVAFLAAQLSALNYTPHCTCGMDDNMHESDCAIVEWENAKRV